MCITQIPHLTQDLLELVNTHQQETLTIQATTLFEDSLTSHGFGMPQCFMKPVYIVVRRDFEN